MKSAILNLRNNWKLIADPSKASIPLRVEKLISNSTKLDVMKNTNRWATMEDIRKFELTAYELENPEYGRIRRVVRELSGRMTGNEAVECNGNAIHGKYSVNLKIHVPQKIIYGAKSWIDKTLIPKANDTVESLIERISSSSWCDEINYYYPAPNWNHVTPEYIGLTRHNSSKSAQPRRRSESVVVNPIHIYEGDDGEGKGKSVITLYVYTSFGRHPDDWRGRPMRLSTFNLGLYVWRASWSYLTIISRSMPPTHCQIMIYYSIFNGAMEPHRDNSTTKDLERLASGMELGDNGHPSAGSDNSQIVGSNVLVYTTGNAPQTFTLKFPKKTKYFGNRNTYVTTSSFQFQCGDGTVSVLDPIDDLLMTHSVHFEKKLLDDVEAKKKDIEWDGVSDG